MTRFLIDEDLPPALGARLRQEGRETTHINDLGPRGSSDAAVFKLA